ncbi:hypothetical protein MMC30_004594 [Trapelia coarctata]|nr:hypothetical protein [Trapelia coarctata]
MASSSSPKVPSKHLEKLAQVLPHYISRTNAQISHINKLLASTPHLDITLLTLTYTLHLVHAVLLRAPTLAFLSRLFSRLKPSSIAVIPPDTTIIALSRYPTSSIARLTTSLAAFTSLIDDFRIFLRLPALLSIWAWGASVYRSPPKDSVLRAIAWAQVISCALFQALENAAYLGSKGVVDLGRWVEGGNDRGVVRAYVWSSRFWMVHVALEFGRLGRAWALRAAEETEPVQLEGAITGGTEVENEGGKETGLAVREAEAGASYEKRSLDKRTAEERAWWKDIYVNAAWLPLTMHWSTEEGIASEAQVAILGMIPGILGLRDAWKVTA